MVPPGRSGTVAEVPGLVSYPAGPESGFVTGASLTIDGGLTALLGMLTGLTAPQGPAG